MNAFEFAEPRSLAEAIALLDTDDSSVRAFSGGTALMLMMKSAVFSPSLLVSLRHIEASYSGIIPSSDGGLNIGAMASLSAVENSTDVIRLAPTLSARDETAFERPGPQRCTHRGKSRPW